MSGKGSRPRPYSVDLNTFDNNWDAIFSKKRVTDQDMQVAVNTENKRFGSCGCGRSPSGDCCGWHGLTHDEYLVKLAEYNEQQAAQNTNNNA